MTVWPDNRHFATQNIDQHRKPIKASAYQKAANKSFSMVTTRSKPQSPDMPIVVTILMPHNEYRSSGFNLNRQRR